MSWEPIIKKDEEITNQDEVIGDETFDLLSDTFGEFSNIYFKYWKRKPTLNEFLKTVEMVLQPRWDDFFNDVDGYELLEIKTKIKKRPKRIVINIGDIFKIQLSNDHYVYGRLFFDTRNIISYNEFEKISKFHNKSEFKDNSLNKFVSGPLVAIYDSLNYKYKKIEEIMKLHLITKVSIIHPDFLTLQEWKKIGNVPIQDFEYNYIIGITNVIMGTDEHKESALYHYKLSKEKNSLFKDYIY